MDAVELVASVTSPLNAVDILEFPRAATWLQIRADLIGDVPANWLRENFPGKLLYSLRSCRAGGKFEGLGEERHSRLIAAARDYDLVELEADSDLGPELLAAIPATKRMVSCRSVACDVAQFHSCFQQIAAVPARYYCVSASAARTSDGLHPLLFLQALSAGTWSRFAKAPLVYGADCFCPILERPFCLASWTIRPARWASCM